jgi:hypothetical protein
LEGVIIIRRTDDGQKTKEGEKKSFELQLLRSQLYDYRPYLSCFRVARKFGG